MKTPRRLKIRSGPQDRHGDRERESKDEEAEEAAQEEEHPPPSPPSPPPPPPPPPLTPQCKAEEVSNKKESKENDGALTGKFRFTCKNINTNKKKKEEEIINQSINSKLFNKFNK